MKCIESTSNRRNSFKAMVNATWNISEVNPAGSGRTRELLNSEPVPNWEEAKAVFKWGWELHWISFVVLFMGLALYSTIRLIEASKRRTSREKVSRNVSYAVHSLVIVLGVTRAVALVLFPYEMTTNVNDADIVIPLYVHRIIFGLGFPCFMAAFALIQITFTASVKTAPLTYSKLRKIRFLVLIIVGHFSVVIIADIVTALVESTSALYMVCTAYLLSMTLFTGVRITKSGLKVIRENNRHKKAIENYAPASTYTPHRLQRASFNAKAVRKVFTITALTIFFCIALFALKIYDLVEVIEHHFVLGKNIAPWPWFIHETLFRLTEFGLALTVLYAVSPIKTPKKCLSSFGWCCCKAGKGQISGEKDEGRQRTGTNEMTSASLPPEHASKTYGGRLRTGTNEMTSSSLPPEHASKTYGGRPITGTNQMTSSTPPPERASKTYGGRLRTGTNEMTSSSPPPELVSQYLRRTANYGK
ncbi:uncharacterized protein LOC144656327 [Oculina patagonica]